MSWPIKKNPIFAAVIGSLLAPAGLHAQSCALCYQSAASAGAQFIQGLRDGILVLLFPPLVIGLSLAIMAYRKRNTFSGSDSTPAGKFRRKMAAAVVAGEEFV